ncbi:MAG: hypothetical protein AAGE01_15410 [Pseudomonadota bacterium]
MKFAPFPMMCRSCQEDLMRNAMKKTEPGQVAQHCPHLGGALVQASIDHHDGELAVVKYEAIGPIEQAAALEMVTTKARDAGFEPEILNDDRRH